MASGGTNSLYAGDGGFFIISASVLCWHDHIITFDEEVRCVWQKRISGAGILFLLNRYLTLASSLVSIVQFLPWHSLPEGPLYPYSEKPLEPYEQICSAAIHFLDVCLILTTLTYTIFAALRMYALYGLSKPVFSIVLVIGLISPGTQIFLMTSESITTALTAYNGVLGRIGSRMPYGRSNCYHTATHDAKHLLSAAISFPLLRGHALVFEGILITLTWRKTRSEWNLQDTNFRTPFTTMLLRYGTLYFIIIAAASASNAIGSIVFWVSYHAELGSKGAAFTLFLARASPLVDVMTPLCMSRFILGLLGIEAENRQTMQWSSFQRLPLHFAALAETIAVDMDDDSDTRLNSLCSDDGSGVESTESDDIQQEV